MPNRIIREGWIDSERIDALSVTAERFFLRLCLKADDFGRYSANVKLLRSSLYPLKDDVRDTDISRDLAACERAGLVRCYEGSGKRYLVIPEFRQRTRASESKWPAPPEQMSGACPTYDGHTSDTSQTSAHGGGDVVGDGDGGEVGGDRARGGPCGCQPSDAAPAAPPHAQPPGPSQECRGVGNGAPKHRSARPNMETAPPPEIAAPAPRPERGEASQQANHPDLAACIEWGAKQPGRYTPEEVGRAFRQFEAGRRQEDGAWMWGHRPVGDWRAAMAERIEGNREKGAGGKPPTSGAQIAERIMAEKELARVEQRIATIRNGYDSHQETTKEDRAELSRLRKRREELKATLGFAA